MPAVQLWSCAEPVEHSVHLSIRFVIRPVRRNHVICTPNLLGDGQLRCYALACFCIRYAIARAQTTALRVRGARNNDDRIEITISAHFVQKRNISDGEGKFLRIQRSKPPVGRVSHRGMDDRLERPPRLGVGEHDSREALPVQGPVGVQHLPAKAGTDRGETACAWGDGVPRQDIRVDRWNTERLEPRADVALAARDSACEGNPSDTGAPCVTQRHGDDHEVSASGRDRCPTVSLGTVFGPFGDGGVPVLSKTTPHASTGLPCHEIALIHEAAQVPHVPGPEVPRIDPRQQVRIG